MSERKLASISRIDKLEPIEGADKILKATIGGWQLVTAKDNGFQEGDLVVYLEVDSWVPHELAPFLSKGQEPREFNGVKGERLRTIKLRGQVSQGLILPLSALPHSLGFEFAATEGEDVTEWLRIQKWERPLSPQLAGQARGNFPSFIFKTDQERIQNLGKEFQQWKAQHLTWEITEKLEGSSMTVYLKDDEFGVCSRNINLKETEGNTFWSTARLYKLEDILREYGGNIAIQGELIGPGIQGNIYGLTEHQFRVFDIFDIDKQEYWPHNARVDFTITFGIPHSPLLGDGIYFEDTDTIMDVIAGADGTSMLAKVDREGLVFKCIEKPEISFKAISNRYLLGEK